ncbi:MAG TPA: glycosyltransferase [Dehalococcoidia bacterium]|nr:glycosyltransferase [Dehalococcoidia bacterium]
MRPTRVAMLSLHTSPLAPLGGSKAGGMNLYVRRITERLSALGVAVDVFTRRVDVDSPDVEELAPGARLIQITAGAAEPIDNDRLIMTVEQFAEGVEAFRSSEGVRYDVVHSHYWLSIAAGDRLVAGWARPHRNVPHLAMFHTLGDIKLRARASEHEPEVRLDAERALVHSVDRVVAATEHERRMLAQLYRVERERVSVTPLGVDMDQFQPRDRAEARSELGLPADGRILLAVGRVEPLKGFDILIRALADMTEDEDVTLVILGGDERAATEFARLTAIAEEVGVASRVMLPGATQHERLAKYYNAADVVVIPSFYESFGLVALEAMASGVPVVASRVGGLPSTVADGRTGYLISWRCPEPFAEKLDLLLTNEGLRSALGSAGVTAAERFAWEKVAASLIDLYEEVLDSALSIEGAERDQRPVVAGGD